MPGPVVRFSQTDFNRHFTVREIVRDSERGMYNLVHVTGLAHLEHHFAVMFFASDVKATFTKEIVEGERYEMRVRVAGVRGPLADIEVSFHNAEGDQCFQVTWSLMLVRDVAKRLLYDFEVGLPAEDLAALREIGFDDIGDLGKPPPGVASDSTSDASPPRVSGEPLPAGAEDAMEHALAVQVRRAPRRANAAARARSFISFRFLVRRFGAL